MASAAAEDDLGKGGVPSISFGSKDMVEQIRNLTDVGSMTRLLHECIAHQRGIDEELEALLSQRHELEKKLSDLHKSSEVLEIVKADSDQMLLSVSSTCDLADHVSGKVRELDLAQSRVQSTLTRIDAIVERGNCIDGAKQALESEDYESAAKYVETFLQLDAKYRDSIATGSEGGKETATEQRNQLLESKQKLQGVIKNKQFNAIEQWDHSSVLRFIKFFPPLGLEKEGSARYTFEDKILLSDIVLLRA